MMKTVPEDTFYEMLKSSPLCKGLDVAPEESAMWLESHMLGNAAGVKKAIGRALVRMNDTNYDYIEGFYSHLSFNPTTMQLHVDGLPQASKMVLKSVFEALFIAGMLDSKPRELVKVLKWAKKKHAESKALVSGRDKEGKAACKKWQRCSCHDELDKLEALAELVERLEAKLKALGEKRDSI